jgi:hypothetical protein
MGKEHPDPGTVLLSDILKKRFVEDFIVEMKKLDCDRARVLDSAYNCTLKALADEGFEVPLELVKQIVDDALKDNLNKVFGEDSDE